MVYKHELTYNALTSSRETSMNHDRGLTLIEMLIVVAIIGALFALLAVALHTTTYPADLAKCAANLKTIADGELVYAMDHQRAYTLAKDQEFFDDPTSIAGVWNDSDLIGTADVRPVIKGYISLKTLVCPLSPHISLAEEDTGTPVVVLSSYNIWAGWQYKAEDAPPEDGMFRIGDRWTWAGVPFRILAGDWDTVATSGNTTNASHPDATGVMTDFRFQARGAAMSGWVTGNSANPTGVRGPLDTNAAFDDASVHRYTQVKTMDERMKRTGALRGSKSNDHGWINVPAN
jgi:prepilin-type N-terminal cleavage/methylation domain-containing protein